MGRLFGLNAPAPSNARVLELGCAAGANLLPMAQHAPQAKFLGIDASARQIAAGQEAISAAGLTNVELRHQDILDFPAAEGKFDYIIVHGIYSWVTENVRKKILDICCEHLAEHGVAYISYNAFPGWGMRMALRDMMLFHTAAFPDATTKVGQAKALMKFLSDSVPTEGSPYGLLLREELERLNSQPDHYVFHDILEGVNQPFYFHEFVQQAMGAGLQYLSETSLDQMLATNFDPKVSETLAQISGNIIAKEQYMDFLRNRSFRRTLLCHQGVKLQRALTPASLKSFYYTSTLAKSANIDFLPGATHEFKLRVASPVAVSSSDTFVKALFDTLAEYSLARVSFDELLTATKAKAEQYVRPMQSEDTSEVQAATVMANLMELYARGILSIYAERPEFLKEVSEKPAVTPLARHQALKEPKVTSLAHYSVPIDMFGRYVMAACDGTRDRAAIVTYLFDAVKSGKLQLNENNQPVTDEARIRLILEDRVGRVLLQIAAYGFFIA